jgi:hypothetical protein
MSPQLIKNGFIAAALMNIGGVLLFSKAFNNPTINQFDPVVMSNFGLLMIIVWGLAYLGAAFVTTGVKWLAGAFAIEKLVYVLVWVFWIQDHSLASVYQQDLLAGVFYSIYGLNDLIFMLFFALVFISTDSSPERQ